MTLMRNYGIELATAVLASFAHATSHRLAVELHACATEPVSLHDGCSSKQARRGASYDVALPASCPRHCRTSKLRACHRPLRRHKLHVPATSSAMMSIHPPKCINCLSRCCKYKSRCYICSNTYIKMFHLF
jgi:hypothetical protein